MTRTAILDVAHHRLALFWAVASLGLVGPWLLGDLEWSAWSGGTAGERTCSVASVHDGDTLRAVCAGEKLKVRFYCIDAPEMAQRPWGTESRDHLRRLVGREVRLRIRDTDRYGRKVAEVLSPEGENLNRRMVRDGQAAVYRQYCPDPAYVRLERDARTERLGIWSQPGLQQTPWRYRHASR